MRLNEPFERFERLGPSELAVRGAAALATSTATAAHNSIGVVPDSVKARHLRQNQVPEEFRTPRLSSKLSLTAVIIHKIQGITIYKTYKYTYYNLQRPMAMNEDTR